MLAVDHYPDLHPDATMPNHELLEIHRSKISLHRAKEGYNYPTILLPHTLSKLAGLPTHIYQTVHNGALAFLVVVSSTAKSSPDRHENACSSAESSVFTRRRLPVRIRPSPSFFLQSATLKPGSLEIVNIRKRGEADKIGMGG
jgi:hypothetical protein